MYPGNGNLGELNEQMFTLDLQVNLIRSRF